MAKRQPLTPLDRLPSELYWSEPPATDADFMAADPLAIDYLGQQVGLWMFPGLTTRTSRAQYYAVVAYGLHLVDLAIRTYNYPADDSTRTKLFERWERFWAMAVLESRDGQIPAGDRDSIRGVRGATSAWSPGTRPLPLDYPLISRQSELGGLGAYLTSLRYHDLVYPGGLQTTPAAEPLVAAFWDEPGSNHFAGQYERYALSALDLEAAKVPRRFGKLTLGKVGLKSRLSALAAQKRKSQQERLWTTIFVHAKDDSTLPLAEALIAATRAGIAEPETLLRGFQTLRWKHLPASVLSKVEIALAFGRAARRLLARFNHVYSEVDRAGWIADIGPVARTAFPVKEQAELDSACTAVLEASQAVRFRTLEFHGPGFIRLLQELQGANPVEAVRSLLRYHAAVHRSRRGGGTWIDEQQGKLTLQITSYRGHLYEETFPSLKLPSVRSLLHDLGRID